MIGKISKGDNFGGLAHYLTKGGRGQVLDLRHLSANTVDEAMPEMTVAASRSRRAKKQVLHLTVSYDPADPEPTDDDMRADATEILAGLGLADSQALIVRHRDTDHPHMHIMANRIGADGRAVSDSNSYAKVETALRRIETRRGLSTTSGRHAPDPDGQRMTGAPISRDPRQHTAPDGVRDALLTAQSWDELNGRLAAQGWRMEKRQKAGKRPGAVLIGPEGQTVAAGKMDRQATYSNVSRRIRTAEAETARQERAKARAARQLAYNVTQVERTALKTLTATSRRLTGNRRRRSSFGLEL